MENEGYERIINEVWGRRYRGSSINQIMMKLSMCRRKLKEWSKSEVPNNVREIKALMKRIGSVQDGCNSVQDYEEMKEINERLKGL